MIKNIRVNYFQAIWYSIDVHRKVFKLGSDIYVHQNVRAMVFGILRSFHLQLLLLNQQKRTIIFGFYQAKLTFVNYS